MKIIQSKTFASSFVLRPHSYTWLLGAGSSASAGIPTGFMMIQDFKTELFCIENNLPRNQVDASDQKWIERIEEHFSKRATLPPSGSPTEYSEAFQALYPDESLRRAYIDKAITAGTPSFGHRILGSLIATKNIPSIFTTNFDTLIEHASQTANMLLNPNDRNMLTVAAIDSADRAERCLKESDWPLLTKLHGDYQSTQIKNTTQELQEQDSRLLKVFQNSLNTLGLVVIGYSGRDHSIMNALISALSAEIYYPTGIYWVAKSEKSLSPLVTDFLKHAENAGVNASVVISENFDEFFGDIVEKVRLPDALSAYVFESRPHKTLTPVQININEALKFPVLRCSGVPVESLPANARYLKLGKPTSIQELRDKLKASKVNATIAIYGDGIAAFGQDSELLSALAASEPTLNGYIELNPLRDSWAKGLIYDALIKSISRGKPLIPLLSRRGHSLIISRPRKNADETYLIEHKKRLAKLSKAYKQDLTGIVPNYSYEFSEGIQIKLEFYFDKWWCVFEPFTQVTKPKEISADPTIDWRRERWATKYNSQWAEIIDAWADLIVENAEEEIHAYGISPDQGVDATFLISSITAWSRPSHNHPYFKRTY